MIRLDSPLTSLSELQIRSEAFVHDDVRNNNLVYRMYKSAKQLPRTVVNPFH